MGTFWLALLSLTLAGCGESDGLPREALGGSVTLDGQPLPEGAIQILPVSKQGTAGGAVIKDGKFEIEREKGLVPGQYYVVINSVQATTPTPSGEPPGPVNPSDAPKDLIPTRYNRETTLTAEVKSGDPNKFVFDLTTK